MLAPLGDTVPRAAEPYTLRVSSALAMLQERLAGCLAVDQPPIARQLRSLERLSREGKPHDRLLAAIRAAIDRSCEVRSARAAQRCSIAYPSDLPISAHQDAVRSALETHQVLVVTAATGSGKTTQLPKMLLEAGYGIAGTIAHTQPRRLAARSVATRLARELQTPPGTTVGYRVRFDATASPASRVIVMTDGILLAQLRGDPTLLQHDAIIVDEAHERSLNIDLLLGALRRILRIRPELRVIISSATLEASRFAAHFDGALVLDVPGRAHPVTITHAPPDGPDPDLVQAALDAAATRLNESNGDGLVFFASEREIHEFVEAARGRFPGISVLPLFSRLSSDQQDRIFTPGSERRIIATTNIAETSVTVPRVGWVVDTGLVRLSRYSPKSRLQRLPIEPISLASAAQRAGRAGRLFPGACIRLYPDDDGRPAFTVPEVQRANLSGVVLQLAALGLGHADHFPWIDPPSVRLVREAQETLIELGAFTRECRITPLGRGLAQWPLDPRLARTIVAGQAESCLAEALVLAARMAIQDPRERPSGAQDRADLAHALLRDPRSDAMGALSLWRAWKAASASLGSSARRRWCTERFLSPLRMREWEELHGQLRRLAGERLQAAVPDLGDTSDPDRVHRAVLAGFVSHIAMRQEDGTYQLPSGQSAEIHPSSALARSGARWVVAVEVVDTGRRWLREVSRIRPEWVEAVAPGMVERRVSEPHWRVQTGQVAAWERATMGALTVIPRRRVPYGPLDPAGARQIFLQSALVGGELPAPCSVIEGNQALRSRLLERQERERRHDLLAGPEAEFAFYDARIPARMHSWPSFRSWLASGSAQATLTMTERDLLGDAAAQECDGAFPSVLVDRAMEVPLRYAHAPGQETDGIEAQFPLAALATADPARYDWLVPGRHDELIGALLRLLPKRVRTRCIPAATVAAAAALDLADRTGDLRERFAQWVSAFTGLAVQAGEIDLAGLPAHLRMSFAVVMPDGRVERTRDLRLLQDRYSAASRDAFASGALDALGWSVWSGRVDSDWPWPDLPLELDVQIGGHRLIAHPALEAVANGARLTVFPQQAQAQRSHAAAIRALVHDALQDRLACQARHHPGLAEACAAAAHRWLEPQVARAVTELAIVRGVHDAAPPRGRDAFHATVASLGEQAWALVHEVLPTATAAWRIDQRIERTLQAAIPTAWQRACADVASMKERVLPADALNALDWPAWERLPRALAAVEARLQRIEERGALRDEARIDQVIPWRERALAALERARTGDGHAVAQAAAFHQAELEWELGVFAQDHAPSGHSQERLERLWTGLHPSPRSF